MKGRESGLFCTVINSRNLEVVLVIYV